MPNPLQQLIDGFESFRARHFEAEPDLMQALAAEGQRPEVMVIACSDSRVDPAILTCARPGDLFIVRNVAAMVPAYDPARSPQGTSSAVEFGVRGLEVRHIVVLGHAQCGGMRFLAEEAAKPADRGTRFEFLGDWVRLNGQGLRAVLAAGIPPQERGRAIEQAGVLASLHHLLSFPWLKERVERRRLVLHGWYFDLASGRMLALDAGAARFVPALGHARPVAAGTALPALERFAASYVAEGPPVPAARAGEPRRLGRSNEEQDAAS